jgi:5-hydroxyisourate hydrolase-like protein (transthyretin family)
VRVELLTPRLEMAPGGTAEIGLEVWNAGDVIDTVSTRVVGTYAIGSEQRPGLLSLFPDSGDRVTVVVTLPDDFPAGGHLLPIEVSSTMRPDDVEVVNVDLEVSPVVRSTVALTPSELTGGRKARFSVDVTNEGNVPLNLTLTGTDAERLLRFRFDPMFVRLAPGERAAVSGVTQGKRPLFGAPVARPITVVADGPGVEVSAAGRFTQRPRVPKGALTILALTAIVGLWAAVFVSGSNLVLAKDALAKSIPAAFLAGDQDFAATSVAGSMAGTVAAATSGAPVERITVEAYRVGTGGAALVASAATLDDGTWELASVVPGSYALRFSAPGFEDVWYPSASSQAAATLVRVRPLAATADLGVQVTGLPGSISGAVAAGEQQVVVATVAARSVVDEVVGDPVAEVTSNPDGSFTIPGLATPGVYELSVALPGFDAQTVRAELGGGEAQVINTVDMAAAQGTVSGTVLGAGGPLGGATVTITGAGETKTATTPTAGAVGAWTFTGLPTPGTYLLTFQLEGYGTETIALDLAAGEARGDVVVVLVQGTGTVSGVVKDASGTPLGGAIVTVTGGGTPITTNTLTTGAVGFYELTGLKTPGRYTISYALEGYTGVTLSVDLSVDAFAEGVDATLSKARGSISGTVRSGGAPLAGATIVATDGQAPRETTSVDEPAGGYRFDGLPAGSYTVTVTADGLASRTVLVNLGRGQDVVVDVALGS